MSKQIDALKLALEFIERVNKDGWILADFEFEMYATITAIKEALANVATNDTSQERVDEMQKQRHEQEPVCDKDPQGCWSVRCQLGKKCKNTPPHQKPLTDEQIQTVHDNVPDDYTEDSWVHSFARAIEAAHGIKENT